MTQDEINALLVKDDVILTRNGYLTGGKVRCGRCSKMNDRPSGTTDLGDCDYCGGTLP